MEEEAQSRRSVAELAGRFKGPAPPCEAAGQETEKPIRRRPPRSLQLPKTHGDEQEPAGVTSPLPAKAKRNSLIEKLQANLVLSPTALLPSPKSPGFRLLPPAFPLASSGSAPANTATSPSTPTPISPAVASPLTEEGPSSFEAPPTAAEGSILSNINKGRARHSLRRRPPSRRHRKTSTGDDVDIGNEEGDTCQSSPCEHEDKTTEGGGGGEKEEDKTDEVKEEKTDEVKEEKTDASTKNKSNEEEKKEIDVEPSEEGEREEEQKGEAGLTEGGEGDVSSSIRKEEEKEEEAGEKNSAEKQEDDSAAAATNTESREEEKSEETTCQNSS
uniref:duboraya isoform X2 n=1 Tax=Semicossyphus pulcher TaxID=241346 RepID=UPI0037E8AFB9